MKFSVYFKRNKLSRPEVSLGGFPLAEPSSTNPNQFSPGQLKGGVNRHINYGGDYS